MDINKNIKRLIKDRNITIIELAGILDMSERGVYRMLNSDSYKAETLIKIAKYFNVPISYLFDGEQDKTNSAKIVMNSFFVKINSIAHEIYQNRESLNTITLDQILNKVSQGFDILLTLENTQINQLQESGLINIETVNFLEFIRQFLKSQK